MIYKGQHVNFLISPKPELCNLDAFYKAHAYDLLKQTNNQQAEDIFIVKLKDLFLDNLQIALALTNKKELQDEFPYSTWDAASKKPFLMFNKEFEKIFDEVRCNPNVVIDLDNNCEQLDMLLSPNMKLCEVAEFYEDKIYETLSQTNDQGIEDRAFEMLKEIFVSDFKTALTLTNNGEDKIDLDYDAWSLAADSFQMNQLDLYAIAIAERAANCKDDRYLDDVKVFESSKMEYVTRNIFEKDYIEKNHIVSTIENIVQFANRPEVPYKERDSIYLEIEKGIEKQSDPEFKQYLNNAFKEAEFKEDKKREMENKVSNEDVKAKIHRSHRMR